MKVDIEMNKLEKEFKLKRILWESTAKALEKEREPLFKKMAKQAWIYALVYGIGESLLMDIE